MLRGLPLGGCGLGEAFGEPRHAADERISAARVVPAMCWRCPGSRKSRHCWARAALTWLTVPLNLAGLPAVTLPLPAEADAIPASLQLVWSWLGEEQLLSWAARIEYARIRGRKSLQTTGTTIDSWQAYFNADSVQFP